MRDKYFVVTIERTEPAVNIDGGAEYYVGAHEDGNVYALQLESLYHSWKEAREAAKRLNRDTRYQRIIMRVERGASAAIWVNDIPAGFVVEVRYYDIGDANNSEILEDADSGPFNGRPYIRELYYGPEPKE